MDVRYYPVINTLLIIVIGVQEVKGECKCFGTSGYVCSGNVSDTDLRLCPDATRLIAFDASFPNCHPGYEYLPKLKEINLKPHSSFCRSVKVLFRSRTRLP